MLWTWWYRGKCLLLVWMFFWGPGDFQVSFSNRDTSWNAWNCHSGRFIVDTGILFSNMKPPSHECWMTFWPLTSCSDFIMTLIPRLTFTELRVMPMEHLQRMWHAIRERLPFWTPGSVLFRNCICPEICPKSVLILQKKKQKMRSVLQFANCTI